MRTVEYYLEKGFALPYAEYFANGRKSIIKATSSMKTRKTSVRCSSKQTRMKTS